MVRAKLRDTFGKIDLQYFIASSDKLYTPILEKPMNYQGLSNPLYEPAFILLYIFHSTITIVAYQNRVSSFTKSYNKKLRGLI